MPRIYPTLVIQTIKFTTEQSYGTEANDAFRTIPQYIWREPPQPLNPGSCRSRRLTSKDNPADGAQADYEYRIILQG
jgi:hypothetical protein